MPIPGISLDLITTLKHPISIMVSGDKTITVGIILEIRIGVVLGIQIIQRSNNPLMEKKLKLSSGRLMFPLEYSLN